MFNKIELRQQENKANTNKNWMDNKAYVVALCTEKHMYQEDVGVTKNGFESANSFGELKSEKKPFNGQTLGGSSIDTILSIRSGTVGASARDKAWTEYVDILKKSLLKTKEFVVSMTSAQDTLINESKEERK